MSLPESSTYLPQQPQLRRRPIYIETNPDYNIIPTVNTLPDEFSYERKRPFIIQAIVFVGHFFKAVFSSIWSKAISLFGKNTTTSLPVTETQPLLNSPVKKEMAAITPMQKQSKKVDPFLISMEGALVHYASNPTSNASDNAASASMKVYSEKENEEFSKLYHVFGDKRDYPHWNHFVDYISCNDKDGIPDYFKPEYYNKFIIELRKILNISAQFENNLLVRETLKENHSSLTSPVDPDSGEERYIWSTDNLLKLFKEVLFKDYLLKDEYAAKINTCITQLVFPLLDLVREFEYKRGLRILDKEEYAQDSTPAHQKKKHDPKKCLLPLEDIKDNFKDIDIPTYRNVLRGKGETEVINGTQQPPKLYH